MIKERLSTFLHYIGHMLPWLVYLLLLISYSFPRVFLFISRESNIIIPTKNRIWRIRKGPLKGFKLTGLLPAEIASVLANRMEISCSSLLEHLSLNGMIALDVGGSYGYFALLLARLVGDSGVVHSFEPDWQSFGRLTRNISLNGCSNSSPIPLCLSNVSSGLVKWISFDDMPWESHISNSTPQMSSQRSIVVPVSTLDQYISSLELSTKRIGFIKIDVEGDELKVLQGAVKLISREYPLILCELHGAEVAMRVIEFMTQFGYDWIMVEYQGPMRQHIFAYHSNQADQYEDLVSQFAIEK